MRKSCHRTCVESLFHAHDGHSRFAFTAYHCPLNGRRTSKLRQERRVHVPRAELGYDEQIGRQDPTIGHNHEQIGATGCKLPSKNAIAQLGRLENGQAKSVG
jgi:hypothetical protein